MQAPVESPTGLDSGEQALHRLIGGTTSRDEVPSLLEAVSLSAKAIDRIRCLQGREAQAFIDVVDQVRCHTLPSPQQLVGFDNVDLDRRWKAPTWCRTFEITV